MQSGAVNLTRLEIVVELCALDLTNTTEVVARPAGRVESGQVRKFTEKVGSGPVHPEG